MTNGLIQLPTDELHALASQQGIQRDQLDGALSLRSADITAVNTAARTATIRLGGDTTDIPDIAYLNSYLPTTGDTGVLVLVSGTQMWLIGALSAGSGPRGVLGFAELTTDSSTTSGSAVLDVLSAPAVTPESNRVIKITVQWRSLVTTVLGDVCEVYIREGSTLHNSQNHRIDTASVGQAGCTMVHYIDSPSAASHTYKISIARVAGTGACTMNGASFFPIQIIVEDIGSS